MPIETIKCQECGSADVTEFKAGSYVCGHCEAIFKHVVPAAAGGGCEIDGCGVPAVGRCSSCSRRFCATHQAHYTVERWVDGKMIDVLSTATYNDRCSPCHGDQLARERARKQAAKARARAPYKAAHARWEAAVRQWEIEAKAALMAVPDPIERFMCACRYGVTHLAKVPQPSD